MHNIYKKIYLFDKKSYNEYFFSYNISFISCKGDSKKENIIVQYDIYESVYLSPYVLSLITLNN